MFPMENFIARYREIQAALDALTDERPDDDLEDLNAELDDMLMALEDIRPSGEGWREELAEALEDMDAIADDYAAIAARVPVPGLDEPLDRLRRANALLRGSLDM